MCFKCKKYGHYANVCPSKDLQTQSSNDNMMGGAGGGQFGMQKLTGGIAQMN